MIVRPWAEFSSDFPEDGVEDEDGVLQFRGRAVAETVVDILNGLGFRVSAPEYDDHGWGFDFWASERRFWCQLTAWDETYALLCDDISRTLTDKLFKRPPNPIYVETMKRLGEAVGAHPRFDHVRWYSGNDIGSGGPGTVHPLVDDE